MENSTTTDRDDFIASMVSYLREVGISSRRNPDQDVATHLYNQLQYDFPMPASADEIAILHRELCKSSEGITQHFPITEKLVNGLVYSASSTEKSEGYALLLSTYLITYVAHLLQLSNAEQKHALRHYCCNTPPNLALSSIVSNLSYSLLSEISIAKWSSMDLNSTISQLVTRNNIDTHKKFMYLWRDRMLHLPESAQTILPAVGRVLSTSTNFGDSAIEILSTISVSKPFFSHTVSRSSFVALVQQILPTIFCVKLEQYHAVILKNETDCQQVFKTQDSILNILSFALAASPRNFSELLMDVGVFRSLLRITTAGIKNKNTNVSYFKCTIRFIAKGCLHSKELVQYVTRLPGMKPLLSDSSISSPCHELYKTSLPVEITLLLFTLGIDAVELYFDTSLNYIEDLFYKKSVDQYYDILNTLWEAGVADILTRPCNEKALGKLQSVLSKLYREYSNLKDDDNTTLLVKSSTSTTTELSEEGKSVVQEKIKSTFEAQKLRKQKAADRVHDIRRVTKALLMLGQSSSTSLKID